MKKINWFKIIPLLLTVLAFTVINSCKDSIFVDNNVDELILKSANIDKQSYIIVLSDSDLNEQLIQSKGYEKKQEVVKSAVSKILKRNGISDENPEHIYSTALIGFSVKIPPGQIKKLQEDSSVKSIEKDIIMSVNPGITKRPSGGGNTGGSSLPPQETPYGIIRVGGISSYTGTGIAWIIDTGIDLDHPDLNVNQNLSRTFLGGNTSPDDQNGHGTHVAGTIAAKNNNYGVIGVAPGASVVSVRVLDRRGSGFTSGVIAGVDYVAANGHSGDVANMSLGGGISTALDDAVYAASTVVKFSLAAGNEKDNANNHSPARVNGPNIFTISAMDINDNWASFSNFGNPPVDYCAPGVSVKSCYKDGGYATLSGTSMAAPHVAGVLLLGGITTNGYVNNDPDGNPDPIAHH